MRGLGRRAAQEEKTAQEGQGWRPSQDLAPGLEHPTHRGTGSLLPGHATALQSHMLWKELPAATDGAQATAAGGPRGPPFCRRENPVAKEPLKPLRNGEQGASRCVTCAGTRRALPWVPCPAVTVLPSGCLIKTQV